MKALVNRILVYKGTRYRLAKGKPVPVVPKKLLNMIIREGYVEKVTRTVPVVVESTEEKAVEEKDDKNDDKKGDIE